MARRILDVFLSSTARDLADHRAAIHVELMSTRLFLCVRQEDFGAQNADAVEYCREKVRASDIFIGLTGQRRGWEPDGDGAKRSITEMEHDWAKEAGRRRYLYVAPDDFPVPGDLRDTDEQYARQQAFRKRVMDGGERVVSQKGFEDPERLATDIVKHLLTQLVTGDLITLLRPELLPQGPVSPEEQRPAIAAAVERLADDKDVDLLALAKNPGNVDLADLESKLKTRAETHEAEGRSSIKASAEYWRHIGALAFLHDTRKAFGAYEKALELDPSEPEGWQYIGELQYRLGDLANAERSFVRLLELGKSADNPRAQSIGSVRLGWIFQDHGDLIEAEALMTNAIQFAASAGWQEGMARAYVNLGNILETRGLLHNAEKMYGKGVKLFEELGNKDGMARGYVNLGVILEAHGDLDKAEEKVREGLKLFEELGNKDGIARANNNLGIIYQIRGDFDQAKEMLLKALSLNEELGRKEGMAITYGNLGNIHETSRDPDQAEAMYRKSLALYEEIGGIEGMAIAYSNLGIIYQSKSDKAAMRGCWHKARDLYREMDLSNKVDEMEKWLKSENCGDS